MEVADVEGRLLRSLAVWSALSVGAGSAIWWTGTRRSQPAVSAFGRQNAVWGAVDGLIAGVGLLRKNTDAEEARRRNLRRLLGVNAVLDVGYVIGGAWMVHARDRLARLPRYTRSAATGDGAAIMLQGSFLLALDTSALLRLRASESG